MFRGRRKLWWGLSLLLLLGAAHPSHAVERVEKPLTFEVAIPAGGEIRVENLLGSIHIEGSTKRDVLRIEAQVVAEAKTIEEARALADTIRFDHDPSAASLVHVAFPVDRYTTLRAPKAKKRGKLTGWAESLLRRGSSTVEYDGRPVEVGHARAATALAVHLKVLLPFDVAASFRQGVGSIEGRSVRGRLRLEVDHGTARMDQVYGSLSIVTDTADAHVNFFHGEILEAVSGSGKIELFDVTAKRLALRSDSGLIGGGTIQADQMEVDSASGPIRLAGIEPERFDVRSGSGVVDLATRLTRAREARIQSESGDVTLRVGLQTYFDLLASTKSGSIKTLGLTLDAVEQSGEAARFKHGRGGVEVEVSAQNGSLTVRPFDASRLDILVGDLGS